MMKKVSEMSIDELENAARNYDNLINEGGEGYNPYRQELNRRYARTDNTPQTLHGKLDALYRRIERECGSIAREWGDSSKIDALQASLQAEIAAIEKQIESDFMAQWDRDTTIRRRSEWNDFVRSLLVDGKLTPDGRAKIQERTQKQGWTLRDLKKAIKNHKL